MKMPSKRPPSLRSKAQELMHHIDLLVQHSLIAQKAGDLTRSDTQLLGILTEGPRNMSEISDALGVALSSATGIVGRLVARKLARRERPPENRRRVLVSLTAKGRKAYDRLHEARIELGVDMLEPLQPAERETLLRFFRKMTAERTRD